MKLALIEDDLLLSDTVSDILSVEGFEVTPYFSFKDAEIALYENRFTAVILDVNLPDGNGFDLAKEMRSNDIGTPILFLTAQSSADAVILGFESGGDDYLKKPFEPSELVARLKNLLRRAFFHTSSSLLPIAKNSHYNPLTQQVFTSEGIEIALHTKELEILKLFLSKRGEAITYDEFFNTLWGYGNDPGFDALRAHIKNFRKALPELEVQTIRSIGYRLV
ncbi:MAG: response regulator transcription factor [Sulfuricurvum sp.]|nr:response regulator transcription factor [Sulfuricurvum sp.]MDD5386111.1 response regulator transcription factor [Sulfuricurvum sp.]